MIQESSARWFVFSLCCSHFASSGKCCGRGKNRVNCFQLRQEEQPTAASGWLGRRSRASTQRFGFLLKGEQEGARASLQLPTCNAARHFSLGLCWVVLSISVGMSWGLGLFFCHDNACIAFAGFLRSLLALQGGWMKERRRNLGEYPHPEQADECGKFSLLLTQNHSTTAYCKCLS